MTNKEKLLLKYIPSDIYYQFKDKLVKVKAEFREYKKEEYSITVQIIPSSANDPTAIISVWQGEECMHFYSNVSEAFDEKFIDILVQHFNEIFEM